MLASFLDRDCSHRDKTDVLLFMLFIYIFVLSQISSIIITVFFVSLDLIFLHQFINKKIVVLLIQHDL